MGDLVDITTVPKQERIFYRITSGSIRFQVKGQCAAGIGLATSPYDSNILWFVIGRDGFTIVAMNHKQFQSVPTPDILSPDEFREFWLQWHDDLICLGRDYAEDPFIVHEDITCNLKYITFGVYGNDEYSLAWKFELPPVREQMALKPVINGTPRWVPADAQLPDGALIGGYEKEMLYIIRANHHGSLIPGKFVPSQGVGFISWGGNMHEKSELEVLCGYDCIWLPCSNGRVPAGSVEAGHSEESDNETLYVGRAQYNDCIVPGKIHPSHRVCYIPFDEKEIAVKKYEILVVPYKNIQCRNPFFLYNRNGRML